MFKTNLFNVMARYSDDTCSNPVANLVLRHGCALQVTNGVQEELQHLLDVTMSRDVTHKLVEGVLHMTFPGQTIVITPDKQLYLNGVQMPCVCEAYGGLVSFVASGEVVTILPIKYLEG